MCPSTSDRQLRHFSLKNTLTCACNSSLYLGRITALRNAETHVETISATNRRQTRGEEGKAAPLCPADRPPLLSPEPPQQARSQPHSASQRAAGRVSPFPPPSAPTGAPTRDPAHRVEGLEAAEDDEGGGADGQQQHGPGDGGRHPPAQHLRKAEREGPRGSGEAGDRRRPAGRPPSLRPRTHLAEQGPLPARLRLHDGGPAALSAVQSLRRSTAAPAGLTPLPPDAGGQQPMRGEQIHFPRLSPPPPSRKRPPGYGTRSQPSWRPEGGPVVPRRGPALPRREHGSPGSLRDGRGSAGPVRAGPREKRGNVTQPHGRAWLRGKGGSRPRESSGGGGIWYRKRCVGEPRGRSTAQRAKCCFASAPPSHLLLNPLDSSGGGVLGWLFPRTKCKSPSECFIRRQNSVVSVGRILKKEKL